MNKRVEKPKSKIPLGKGGALDDAHTERFLRANRAEIDAGLQSAKRAIDDGKARPLEPLSELLRLARKAHKRRA